MLLDRDAFGGPERENVQRKRRRSVRSLGARFGEPAGVQLDFGGEAVRFDPSAQRGRRGCDRLEDAQGQRALPGRVQFDGFGQP